MTSNTSTTSTSGVTLMAAMVRARPLPVAIVPATLRLHSRGATVPAHGGDDHVPQRRRLLLDVRALLLEDVVVDDGGERDQDADRGGDERLGAAAHDVPHRAHRVGA